MNQGKTYVIGDIHGSAAALRQCLKRSGFHNGRDTLISLGDLCDGWPETAEVYDMLLEITNLIFVRGNHDQMMLDWIDKGDFHPVWLDNGGEATIDSYKYGVPDSHIQLLRSSSLYYEHDNRLFVHAGIDPALPLEAQDGAIFLWDRTLFKKTLNAHMQGDDTRITQFDQVFIGHCPIHRYGLSKPVKAGGVWMMDTGAGWEGTLSMMDLDTWQVFQSDPVQQFYPPGTGRTG